MKDTKKKITKTALALASSCVLLLLASLNTSTAFNINYQGFDLESEAIDLKTKFQVWKQKYEKEFESLEEEAKAMLTFVKNDMFIVRHNKEGHPYSLGHNEFSHLTSAEFASQFTGYRNKEKYLRRAKNFNNNLAAIDAPDSVDWVARGAVTPPKNQGQCGSCWSFSTTGAVEGAYQIASGELVSLSEQDLVDCNAHTDNGCNGGLMDNAFDFIVKNGGICSEKDYPYKAVQGKCMDDSCKKVVTISGHEDVPKNDEKSLKAAVAKGPVSIAIEADKPVFQFYKGGVFNNTDCGTTLDHGVLLVGYGTDDGKDYWKVKNSWGSNWGERGYIRMIRNENMCGILESPSYPTDAQSVQAKSTATKVVLF